MTLNQMIYFQTLAHEGHMGHAAEKLYISQPSLSVAIARLEEELGLALFQRRGHRLILTEEGNQFLTHVNRILQETEEARLHMERLTDQRNTMIRVGCITPLLRHYFPGNMRDFLAKTENRDVRFDLAIQNTGELVRRLKNGVYDLLLCSHSREDGLLQIPIISEPVVLICAEGMEPLATWEEVAAQPLLGYEEESATNDLLQQIEREQNVSFRYRYRGPTETAIASLAEYGFGYAVIPWSEIQLGGYRIRKHPIPSGAYRRNIYLTTLKDQPPVGAAARFIRHLTQGS